MNISEMIEVLQCYQEEGEVERAANDTPVGSWETDSIPSWDFNKFVYRKKPVSYWANLYEDEPGGLPHLFSSALDASFDAINTVGRIKTIRLIEDKSWMS